MIRIGELAKRTGISIRTLHHYDDVGLLSPPHRTVSGHRLYGREEIVRLQQILSLRQSGLSLDEIGELLSRRDFDAKQSSPTSSASSGRSRRSRSSARA